MSSKPGRIGFRVAAGMVAVSMASPTVVVATPPNILVIVIDDIGIDQAGFQPFGWNQTDLSPQMPVLQSIAAGGVAFTNFWATPECSPSRACLLTGRYGFRTGVLTAIVDPMLPVNQLNPAEITLPKILATAGYRSAMIGKYHLGGSPDSTPPNFGYGAPATTAGLDFYDGYWELPPSIDTTLGGQAPLGTFSCGGIGGPRAVGAACFPDGTCIEGVSPYEAMAFGATPLLDASGNLAATCADGSCAAINFDDTNAYYVWPRVTTQQDGSYTVQANPQREYLTDFISHHSREWILDQKSKGAPWLAFVTHSASHTPIQPPPPSLNEPGPGVPDCTLNEAAGDYRVQYKRMCEGVDRSIGEMLIDLGLMTKTKRGGFELVDPAITNTMIVVVDDNGSLGQTVLPPFAPKYAKQTVYQTGVWVPCIIAGPMVKQPGRSVDDMVNIVDLFGCLADAAGVDWRSLIPPYRQIDSKPMLPYLTDPSASHLRDFDFAIYEGGTFAPGQVGPCIIAGFVVDNLITTPGLCNDNGGCWAGGSAQAPYRIEDYCDLLKLGAVECGGTTYCFSTENPFCDPNLPACPTGTCGVPPTTGQWAVRSGPWKLIVLTYPSCLAPNDCQLQFYKMATPVPPSEPGLDTPGTSAQIDINNMTPEQQAMFDILRTELYATLVSQWYCPGDGNKDYRVDSYDLDGLLMSWGGPGFWDINEDGITDGSDLGELLGDWNPDCRGQINLTGQGVPPCLTPAGG
ncbi:MAG: sulfatase-like hydrolase/transferase [Phycisphaerales bacterium]